MVHLRDDGCFSLNLRLEWCWSGSWGLAGTKGWISSTYVVRHALVAGVCKSISNWRNHWEWLDIGDKCAVRTSWFSCGWNTFHYTWIKSCFSSRRQLNVRIATSISASVGWGCWSNRYGRSGVGLRSKQSFAILRPDTELVIGIGSVSDLEGCLISNVSKDTSDWHHRSSSWLPGCVLSSMATVLIQRLLEWGAANGCQLS